MPRYLTAAQCGWGMYPTLVGDVYRPERTADLGAILRSEQHPHYISRGLGRSYGDTALNPGGGAILHTRLNRLLHFDQQTGVLTCEAGVSLAEIIACFLPKGFFLPVTPGTKFVTIGGAIANDVHGKNHHRDGSIGNFILDFTLLTAAGEVLTCSRAQNPDLFWATLGGIGLTGAILTARLRLIPVESAYIDVEYRQAPDLDAALLALQADDGYQYSVAWMDTLATGKSLGRSVLMLGNHAPAARAPGEPLELGRPGRVGLPFHFPGWVLGRQSVRAFNALYWRRFGNRQALVHYDPYFYPLDAVANWNRMYGRRGFIQYQVTFPHATSRDGLQALLQRLTAARLPSFLAVLKRFGAASGGLLSFPFPGYTLALDIPMRPGLIRWLQELDEVVIDHGGRVYLAKDAVLTAEHCRLMYPELPRFAAIKAAVDPANLFSSAMARRLGIVEGPWQAA